MRTYRTPIICLLIVCTFGASAQNSKKEKVQADTTKRITWAGIPMVNYNRSFGLLAGAMGSMYYKVNETDTISPSSSTMLIGMYSSSKTYFLAAVQNFYLNEDRWRIKLLGGYGDVFFQFFQEIPPGIGQDLDDGIWIDFNTKVLFMQTKIQRQIIKNIYGGIEATLSDATTTFDIKNPITGENIRSEAQMNMVGYNLLYDSRDNVNFPVEGFFVQFSNNFVREWLGSSNNFERYKISFTHFWDISNNSKSILASRFFGDIAAGDVPFQGENVLGGDDLRGYSQGKYRARQVYAIQAELRQNLYKKFGMIAFLGVGSAVDAIGDIPNSLLLPSAGVGLRYMMIAKEKINVGIDVGVGRDDWSLTFRIGETFGR